MTMKWLLANICCFIATGNTVDQIEKRITSDVRYQAMALMTVDYNAIKPAAPQSKI